MGHGTIQPAVAEWRSDVSGVLDAHVERHGAMPGTKTSESRETNKRFNNGVDVSRVGLLPGDAKSSHRGAF
jgi:hypothetical protein